MGFIPSANSPTMSDHSSVFSVSLTFLRTVPSLDVACIALPFSAAMVTGGPIGPIPPIAMSQTSVPFRELSRGATMTSPVGRFIHFRSCQSYFVSVKNFLPFTLIDRLVPAGFLTSILVAPSSVSISLSAKLCILLCSSGVRASDPSVSISIVTPGQCPNRDRGSRLCNRMIFIRKGVSSLVSRKRLI